MSSDSSASEFVKAGTGEIKIAKLVSTLLGAVWLTIAAGWIAVSRTIVQIHVSVLNAVAQMYSGIIRAFATNTVEASEAAWGAAFRAAVEADPLLAPIIFSIEIVVVSGLLVTASRRWI
ncbi:hypothetical protein [Halobellus ordinarius]|uniref:hypothetical protein n=1 Tax=Halobellus ordinarius TaxID=3075120 RepID=UPI00288073F6|nr:hypothetical protein [Halobellus sp. ZY16]